jgi:hypothetical protein
MNTRELEVMSYFNDFILVNIPVVPTGLHAVSVHQFGSKEFYEVKTNVHLLDFYVSYRTVVGYYYESQFFVTEKKYSSTTNRQISQCLHLPIRVNHEEFKDRVHEFFKILPNSQK